MDSNGESMVVLRRTLGVMHGTRISPACWSSAGLRIEPDQLAARTENLQEGPLLRTFSIQDTGGTRRRSPGESR